MYLNVRKIQIKKLNDNDAIIQLKGKTATAKKSIKQVSDLLVVDFYTETKKILGSNDVYFYTQEGYIIGFLSIVSGKLNFMTYFKNLNIAKDREVTSTTYIRSENALQKQINNRFKNR